MSSPPIRFRPRGGGGGRGGWSRPPFRPPFASNPYYASSSSNPTQYSPNPGVQNPRAPNPVTIDQVEAAVAKAHRELIAAGDGVSVWKLCQNAALSLQADSWNALGYGFYQVPFLRNLRAIEGKVNVFIHCFVSVRKMTSLHDLDLEICKSEGIEKFDELGLGPFLRYPLVQYYFSVPADAKEVCKITFEQLIGRLSVFVYRYRNKEMKVEEFLDFLVEKHSVKTREELGVRIQSLGLFIKFIKGCRRTESAALSSIRESGLVKVANERPPETNPEASTSSIFPSDEQDFLVNDDNENDSCNNGKKQKASSSPHLSIIDDMKLLGMKLAKLDTKNDEKKITGNEDRIEIQSPHIFKVIQTDQEKAGKLILNKKDIEAFVASWKEACQKCSVPEVFALMLNLYTSSDKKKRNMQRTFTSYPAVALLNVAVKSVKFDMLDKLYDTTNDMESLGHLSGPQADTAAIESSNETMPATNDSACIEEAVMSATVEGIIKQISNYFDLDHLSPRRGDLLLKHFVLRGCEMWLKSNFSVKEFKSLGYGTFLEFLEKHSPLLHPEVFNLVRNFCSSSTFEVSMIQKQLISMLSQAEKNYGNGIGLTGQCISTILKRQFPSICFQIMPNEPERVFADLTQGQKHFDASSCIHFSASLMESSLNKNSSSHSNNNSSLASQITTEADQLASPLGSVTSKDAMECLLKAPILSDLRLWSHWDLLFAPSLGPLLEWLLNVGSAKELSCLVASDGRIIRIEESTSFDDFFEAAIEGSSFKAAAKLLSLICDYGGSNNIPLPLLKCYARRAIEVIIHKYVDHEEANSSCGAPGQSNSGEFFFNEAEHGKIPFPGKSENNKIREDLCRVNQAYSIVSKFILNCVGQLPSEFRSFATDIFISGLQSFTKDAADIIISECMQVNERIMIHEIGLSLGIVEWIKDYQAFGASSSEPMHTETDVWHRQSTYQNFSTDDGKTISNSIADSGVLDKHNKTFRVVNAAISTSEEKTKKLEVLSSTISENNKIQDANLLIESIRKEEFGLDPDSKNAESVLLKKQHARLGRALHCLSQELYSQDSHFLLELVQNADDNSYPALVEPTLVFILQDTGVIVLNNEQGFSDKNIRALCDVGSSTKKGSNGGYIGQKGIGFKSVFRITDAPEIHSNGFHVKFDITEGQIGFILPTIVPPCDLSSFKKHLGNFDNADSHFWNTCIILPFRSELRGGVAMGSIINLFLDLHPSLLLFLHRLQCIVFKNAIDDKLYIMKREILGDGLITVTHGKDKMNWLVVSQNLPASHIRPDVQTTMISLAFTLQESDSGNYKAYLDQQPVFAFLPLRKYGMKFILQGDFVLPSSREEVDGDSAWNQWLMSEFPNLFINAERSFCALPCFQECPGKGVTAYMGFVPLVGEVQGFFSHLPRMIISKLRLSNCLLLEGPGEEWVPPSKVVRGWDEQARNFLTDNLLKQNLGLGYLSKEIILPDPLAKALGVQEYGPRLLIDILSSICHVKANIRSLGIEWISKWLNAFNNSLSALSTTYLTSTHVEAESNLLAMIRDLPFIPLSDGSYGSVAEGPIWLPCDASSFKFEAEDGLHHFSDLYSKLRTVTPHLFSSNMGTFSGDETGVDDLIRILTKIGVQKLSAHDVITNLILPSVCNENLTDSDVNLIVEYLSFIMIHLQSACSSCHTERAEIISMLQKKPILLTSHGFKSPFEEPVHFGKEYGNFVDINRLLGSTEIKWIEVDSIYLKYHSTHQLSFRISKWREFLSELGVTDFVKVNLVEKNVADILCTDVTSLPCFADQSGTRLFVKDWESPELAQILSALSIDEYIDKCKYLMEILDIMWDENFCTKVETDSVFLDGQKKLLQSSFLNGIRNTKWAACSLDDKLHYPKDLFYDCESVRSILGAVAPYAVPKVTSKKLLKDIGLKVQITLDDSLRVIQSLKNSDPPSASVSQMSKLYTFIWDEVVTTKGKIEDIRSSLLVFIPSAHNSRHLDVVPGLFMTLDEVHWHDPTGCIDLLMKKKRKNVSKSEVKHSSCVTLATFYPGLHDFFVLDCGVLEAPSFGRYLQILLQLSSSVLPSEDVAHKVFQVFVRWADDFKSGLIKHEEIVDLKDALLKPEIAILPTLKEKWVSLHPSFGLVCWSGDEELVEQYGHLDDVFLIYFGELDSAEKELLDGKVATLMQHIGIPSLSEVVCREAITYGKADNTEKASLVKWILPYAQRYIYKKHPDVYSHLKEKGLENISQLQVIVVEKLFYKNSLKGNHAAKNRRFECSSLLQGNILYATDTADAHSVFLELSRLFFNGITDLHIANFLHMITTMFEMGSSNQQIESFIISNQKVPEIPDGEPIWSLSSSFQVGEDEISAPLYVPPMISRQRYPSSARNQNIQPCWPPPNWQTTAPDVNVALDNCPREAPAESSDTRPVTTTASNFPEPELFKVTEQQNIPEDSIAEQTITETETEKLFLEIQGMDQAWETGRQGEFVAYKYFTEKLGSTAVKWVNQDMETGLPYDLIIDEEPKSTYIEVKTTKSTSKDWFLISTNEWHCACEKGDSFRVAWVNLASPSKPKILIFKNPSKLCQQNVLQLAILVPSNNMKNSDI
ncbi:ATPase domain of HSP90 chaperone/DNA topoisomerase II/histidine kinase protein [Dioscorea alata]|uniref:ATPase domain of HSP90 chaperone/DNA topoisomerase II/histidine kinase protein n=1 Tax=Dioscorea alata TaxID=55571 RepID=A0ACB7UC58_DIOAL|nr:ATPase domain of HSP90 chaperone/DNA topoisomerase II/histidine kinase protein [Dioscorea alata]